MWKRLFALLAASSVLAFSGVAKAQNTNPFAGNWILDVSASTFESAPVPRTQTRAYQLRGGETFVFILDGMAADGSRQHFSATYMYDNQEYPMASLNQSQLLTIAYNKVDDRTVEYRIKADGQLAQSGTKELATNGRTMTITTRSVNQQGQTLTDTLVFRRP
ncbi:MAG: hypothetical protein O2971_12410 [Proteobacteria bacterium]|nr:hypothetical protein [Pseudomonadota bacterium]